MQRVEAILDLIYPSRSSRKCVKLLSADGVLIIYTAVVILRVKPGHDMWFELLKGLPGTKLVEYGIVHPDMGSEETGKGWLHRYWQNPSCGSGVRRQLRNSLGRRSGRIRACRISGVDSRSPRGSALGTTIGEGTVLPYYTQNKWYFLGSFVFASPSIS